jgi:aryl-alcohol dehydrogenase-like predicted oxidoreductase
VTPFELLFTAVDITDILVIAAAKELGIAVLGYSPVARGILSMQITKAEDLEDGDMRKHMTRFKGDVSVLYFVVRQF